jgi:hypothetical protein
MVIKTSSPLRSLLENHIYVKYMDILKMINGYVHISKMDF